MSTTPVRTLAPVIHSHTALRGIAAIYVVFFHLFFSDRGVKNTSSEGLFCQFFQWGPYAVVLFFILSGFILNWVYASNLNRMNWPSYFRARVARIVPLYYLTTFIFFPIVVYSLFHYGLRYVGSDYPIKLFLNLTLVSGIIDGWHGMFNGPAWSISVEFFCYLAIFPLLITFDRYVSSKSFHMVILILLSAIFTQCLVICYHISPILIYNWHWDSSWLTQGIFGFSIGFFLCSIYRKSLHCKPRTSIINLVIFASIITFLFVRFGSLPGFAVLYALPFLVYFTAMDQGFFANLLKKSPFQWMGERSYSIYLWHSPMLGEFTTQLHLHKYLSDHIYNFAIILLILGISHLSYRFFECPFRDFIKLR